jgi:hypothetical protein
MSCFLGLTIGGHRNNACGIVGIIATVAVICRGLRLSRVLMAVIEGTFRTRHNEALHLTPRYRAAQLNSLLKYPFHDGASGRGWVD